MNACDLVYVPLVACYASNGGALFKLWVWSIHPLSLPAPLQNCVLSCAWQNSQRADRLRGLHCPAVPRPAASRPDGEGGSTLSFHRSSRVLDLHDWWPSSTRAGCTKKRCARRVGGSRAAALWLQVGAGKELRVKMSVTEVEGVGVNSGEAGLAVAQPISMAGTVPGFAEVHLLPALSFVRQTAGEVRCRETACLRTRRYPCPRTRRDNLPEDLTTLALGRRGTCLWWRAWCWMARLRTRLTNPQHSDQLVVSKRRIVPGLRYCVR